MGNSSTEPATCRHPALNARDDTQSARDGDQYAARHNPFVYFHSIIDSPSCDANVVPLEQLDVDLKRVSTTPNYAFMSLVKDTALGRLGGLPEFRSGDLRDFGGPLGFDTRELGRWDSGLIAFLWDAVRAATSSGLKIDWSSLPEAIRRFVTRKCFQRHTGEIPVGQRRRLIGPVDARPQVDAETFRHFQVVFRFVLWTEMQRGCAGQCLKTRLGLKFLQRPPDDARRNSRIK